MADTRRHNNHLSESILCALRGMSVVLPADRNPHTYLAMVATSCLMNLLLKASGVQWVATLISACGAFSAEMLNTAIERLCDRLCTTYDEDIRDTKDIAAGGVLFWGFAFWITGAWVIVTSPVIPWMRERCASMLMTYLCAVFGGATNMVFLKWARPFAARYPIDFGCTMSDGRRVFGPHKTWVGMASMSLFCGLWQMVIAGVARAVGMTNLGDLYTLVGAPSPAVDFAIGAAIGLAYMVFELPNSFMKRRLGVGAGKSVSEKNPRLRRLLMLIDYADSPLGVSALVCLCTGQGFGAYVLYVIFGTLLHLVVNVVLVMFGVRDSL